MMTVSANFRTPDFWICPGCQRLQFSEAEYLFRAILLGLEWQ
jgi:hypothetical protein